MRYKDIIVGKNVLMICYYYPPLSDVGAKRSVAFSKYFKKHGWNPYVLSVKNPDKTYCSVGSDTPPDGVHAEYSFSIINPYKPLGKINGALSRLLGLFGVNLKRNYLYDIFCIPDHFFGWIPLTFLKALKLIKRYDIDLIYVSCSPFSSAIIGMLLKLVTKKPFVLDFRDPFALKKVASLFKVPAVRIKINQWIERSILRYADIFVVTAKETRDAYLEQYPQIKSKIYVVHNGFDPEFISHDKKHKYTKFTISYTGEFYLYAPQNNIFTDMFFGALSLLKVSKKIDKDNFQFLFYGDGIDMIKDIAEDYGVNDLVVVHSRIPYQKVLNVLSASHLLLLRIVKHMISTKLFEGIPLNIPFIATIPHGEVEEIIRKYSPSSYILTEDASPNDAAEAILDAMSKYKNNDIQRNLIQDFMEEFSREKLTLKLMDIIEHNLGAKE